MYGLDRDGRPEVAPANPYRLPHRKGKFYRQIPFQPGFPYGRMAPLKELVWRFMRFRA
jgi:hypothetical protein